MVLEFVAEMLQAAPDDRPGRRIAEGAVAAAVHHSLSGQIHAGIAQQVQVFEAPLPCVLAAQKGPNEPRYPTLKGIMGAKKKEIKDLRADDLGVAPEPAQLSIVRLETLPPRPPGRIIGGDVKAAAHELVRALREEAKAI